MNTLLLIVIVFLLLVLMAPVAVFGRFYLFDITQKQHSILRNYPILGKIRYITEKMGPELRQYLFDNDNEGKPFSRREFEYINKAAKYNDRIIGYGSQRDFEQPGYYMVNHMFPKQRKEMKINQNPKVETKVYNITSDKLFNRSEHHTDGLLNPYFLTDQDAIVIGKDTVKYPFTLKGFIGQSGMSFGSLGDHAITALSQGLAMAGETWMNTGEGSISPYHQTSDVNLVLQISPGLFGVRTQEGEFSWEEFRNKAQTEQVKAFEIKLAQGAKQRGGHVEGQKVTEEIAEIRNVEPWKTIDSPDRFEGIDNAYDLLNFVASLRKEGDKPVGTKIAVGDQRQIEHFVKAMAETGIVPDFITVDGGNGGSGATYYELADSVGLPTFAALPLVDDLLKQYGIRDKTFIIASGQLNTPNKIAMALALGADLINIARGFMISVGCIMAQVCHTNRCPSGVATMDPKLQAGLSVEEKTYRVCNYLITLRQGVFEMASVAGIDSPRKFTREHLVYKDEFNRVSGMDEMMERIK